jgi:hypothetical protein
LTLRISGRYSRKSMLAQDQSAALSFIEHP